ncbi:hypothetical protein AVDCRST_MAG81-1574 [uncultured Synechococcales cyanobacterium]|uniref:Uncharacterized protein n=1 Tax=uncultured Synechococcales cyanobacterium TaxID=1936017 RepID=A0A6J4VAD9_9CYAN|nr:hypothetical protein AVDCRST_MAG81-1574 [uncultured Synechococcales cyanobacterium]
MRAGEMAPCSAFLPFNIGCLVFFFITEEAIAKGLSGDSIA